MDESAYVAGLREGAHDPAMPIRDFWRNLEAPRLRGLLQLVSNRLAGLLQQL
jgi:hypothetical protein